jgi:hypothetical protein
MKGFESFVDSPDQRTFTSSVNGALLLVLCLHICGFFSTEFRETKYNYFARLGEAFAQGRLDTPTLSEQLDVSIFEGKTYLYWGPAGGWIFAFGNLFCDGNVSDRVVATLLMALNFWLVVVHCSRMVPAKTARSLGVRSAVDVRLVGRFVRYHVQNTLGVAIGPYHCLHRSHVRWPLYLL